MAGVDHLLNYLAELSTIRDTPERAPEVNPDVDDLDKFDDPNEREEADLARGVVMKATVEEGKGDGMPAEGDLVLVHYCCRLANQTVVASSWSNHGGDDVPVAFLCGKGGRRVPRAWELSVMQMKAGELCLVKAEPQYAYGHPDCDLGLPEGALSTDPLEFEIRLLTWFPANACSAVPFDRKLGKGSEVFKFREHTASGWETPREPFDVELFCKARVPSPNGELGKGQILFSNEAEVPLIVTIGAGQVGKRLEAAICSMVEGESSTFLCPTDEDEDGPLVVPCLKTESSWVEYQLIVQHIVQVRDMTGTGEVMKRRIRDGEGEFPMDCPLEDCAVLIHYTVSQGGIQVHDTRGPQGTAAPLEFTLGDGTYPAGLEMAVRLMIPKEVSRVTAEPPFAYSKASSLCEQALVSGINPDRAVEWDIELLSFEKAPNWHQMGASDRIKVVEEMKAAANSLFGAQRYTNAKSKYEKAYKIIQHTFDADGKESEALEKLQIALELNISAVLHKAQDFTGAISWCNKALHNDPDNPKAFYRMGNAYLSTGDYAEAEEAFRRYKELAPSDSVHADTMIAKTLRRRDAAHAKQRQQLRGFIG